MPGLCMGSMLAEMNAVGLTNAGVTHVLCVADKLRNSHPSRFTYHNVAMDDDERQDALQYFKVRLGAREWRPSSPGRRVTTSTQRVELSPRLLLALIRSASSSSTLPSQRGGKCSCTVRRVSADPARWW